MSENVEAQPSVESAPLAGENDASIHDESLVEQTDDATSHSVDEEADAPLSLNPLYESRQERILELLAETYHEKSASVACMGGVKGDLFDLELKLGEHLRRNFLADGDSPDDIEQYSRTIDSLLRVVKQIVQLAQLEQRQQRQNATAAGSQ